MPSAKCIGSENDRLLLNDHWSKVSRVYSENCILFCSLFLFDKKKWHFTQKCCVCFDFSMILFGFKRSFNVVQNLLNQRNDFHTAQNHVALKMFKILIRFHDGCSNNFKQHKKHAILWLVQRFNVPKAAAAACISKNHQDHLKQNLSVFCVCCPLCTHDMMKYCDDNRRSYKDWIYWHL